MPSRRAKLPAPTTAIKPRYPLRVWHAHFAAWLAEQPTTPPATEQLAAATQSANARRDPNRAPVTVSYNQLRTLKERPDFQEVVKEIEKGGIMGARQKFVSRLPELMDLFQWGAERARAKDDVRALASYVVPGLDRALPKHDQLLAQINAPQVFITMTERQLAVEQAGEIEVTVEAIPNPPPDAGPEPTLKALPANTTMSLAEAMRLRHQLEQPKPPLDMWKD